MKKRISITIDAEGKKHIDELCDAFGLTRSHYIRSLIQKEYFNFIAHPKARLNIMRK